MSSYSWIGIGRILLLNPQSLASCLMLLSGMGLGAIVPFFTAIPPTHAQEIGGRSLLAQATATTALMVNPTTGNDEAADGSEQAPFKTITRALQLAQPNTVILLQPGTYSAESGEQFPIALKPGVTLQGNPGDRGQAVVIRGSGFFLSPTFARQKVTLLGSNQAVLTGVTVTNPEPQGYGLWIESSSPVVVDNTFTGSTHDGISITGKSNPLVRGNYFYENGANGMTIYGTSRPEVRENIFEKTGFAININQKAAPLIIGNRITQNKSGIVVQAFARPVLRNNSVEENEQDGLVAIAQSLPDLGTTAEPGGNFFRNNGQLDVNIKAKSGAVPAVGNEMTRTEGELDLTATASQSSAAPMIEPTAEVPANTRSESISASGVSAPLPVKPTPAAPATPERTPTPAQKSPEAPVASVPFGQPLASPVPATPAAAVPATAPIAVPPPATVTSDGISAASFPVPGESKPMTSDRPASPTIAFPVPTALAGTEGTSVPRPMQMVALPSPAPVAVPVTPAFPTPVIASAPSPVVTMAPTRAPRPAEAPTSSVPLVTSRRSLPAVPTPKPMGSAAPIAIAVPRPEAASPILPTPAIMANRTLMPNAPIEIPVPRPEAASRHAPIPAPVASAATIATPGLLPVPNGNVPIGNVGSMPTVNIYQNTRQGDSASPPVPPSRAAALGYPYRVVVDASNETDRMRVKSLVPDAFRSSYQGRIVMQVGAFSERGKADELMQILAGQGVQAVLVQSE